MPTPDKKTLRLALRLHAHLLASQRRRSDQLISLVGHCGDLLTRLLTTQRQLKTCRRRSWRLAEQSLTQNLSYLAGEIATCAQSLQHQAGQPVQQIPLASALLEELVELEAEFGRWQYQAEENVLLAETDSIELEGIELGSFQLRLNLKRLETADAMSALRIVAMDPHPASTNSAVTHPHVSDENLCAGEAASALERALDQGRIADAFVLVRSVLQNYNSSSPYVSLENWSGRPCADCDYLMGEDEGYCCEGCDHDICSECIRSCCGCDSSRCGECLSTCRGCDQSFCPNCLQSCAQCSEEFCSECLSEQICPFCKEKQEQQEKENEHEHEHEDDGHDQQEHDNDNADDNSVLAGQCESQDSVFGAGQVSSPVLQSISQ